MHDYDPNRGLAPLALPPLSHRSQSASHLPALSPRDMQSPSAFSSYSQSNQLPPLTPSGLPQQQHQQQQHHHLQGHRESISAPSGSCPPPFAATTYSDSAPQSRTHSIQHGPSNPPSPHAVRFSSAGARYADRQHEQAYSSMTTPDTYSAPPQSLHTNPTTPTTASYDQTQQPYGPIPAQDGYGVHTPTNAQPPAFGAHPIHHETQYVLSAPHMVAYTGPVSGSVKKRTNRASQACDQCRSRKSKCNEGDPCTHCLQMGATCTYKDSGPPTKFPDKTVIAALSEVLDAVKGPLASLEHKIDSLDRRLTQLQHVVQADRADGHGDRHDLDYINNEPRWQRHNSPHETADSPDACRHDEIRMPPTQLKSGFDNFDGHTTAAHKLIRLWPSVYHMLKDDPPAADYAHQAESRGSLQLFGTGDYSAS